MLGGTNIQHSRHRTKVKVSDNLSRASVAWRCRFMAQARVSIDARLMSAYGPKRTSTAPLWAATALLLRRQEVLRVFVTAITAHIISSYSVMVRTPALCGGDDDAQISNQFQRLYADGCLCSPIGRQRGRCADRDNFSKLSSKSGQSRPESPVRAERADVADNRALSTTSKSAAWNAR